MYWKTSKKKRKMAKDKTYEEVKSPIYGDWKFKHPDGELMFYGDQKKANWYLKRDLAVMMDERTVQLTFEPKGKGSATDLYGSSPKENICAVCGDSDGLTRHHIVPFCYRRFFPEEYKSKNFHDIVPVCGIHHKEYEMKANKLKNKIATQYGMLNEFKCKVSYVDINKRKVASALSCLINRKDVVPAERILELSDLIMGYFKLNELPSDLSDLFKKIEIKKTTRGSRRESSKFKILVAKIENIQEFVEQWRTHFIETMNPRFLPIGWELKRDARRSSFVLTGK